MMAFCFSQRKLINSLANTILLPEKQIFLIQIFQLEISSTIQKLKHFVGPI